MKKLFLLLSIFILVFSLSTANAAINGDMDGDGKITIIDVRLLLQLYINGGWEEEEESRNGFYAVMSNGVRSVSDPETGSSKLKIRLANADDPEGTMYNLASNYSLSDFEGTAIEGDTVFVNAEGNEGKVVFVWAEFNDMDEIKTITVLEDGISATIDGDDYSIVKFNEEIDTNTGYINIGNEDLKVTNDNTKVYMLSPVLDNTDNIAVGFDFQLATDSMSALSGISSGLVAYNQNTTGIKNASYVFIMKAAVSQKLDFSKVEKVTERAGISYVMIDGEWEEVDLENKNSIVDAFQGGMSGDVKELDKQIISYTNTATEKIVINGMIKKENLADTEAVIVKFVEGSIYTFSLNGYEVDVDLENSDDYFVEEYKNHKIVKVDASVNKDNEIVFDDVNYYCDGIQNSTYMKGTRIVIDDINQVLYCVYVSDVDEKDIINSDGTVTYYEDTLPE